MPEGKPFFAGTYWPREDRQGMPGFLRVLGAVSTAWADQREQVLESANTITKHLHELQGVAAEVDAADRAVADQAAKLCVQAWDDRNAYATSHVGWGMNPAARWECTQPITARIPRKDARNECGFYEMRTSSERETTSGQTAGFTRPDDPRKAFEDLFRK